MDLNNLPPMQILCRLLGLKLEISRVVQEAEGNLIGYGSYGDEVIVWPRAIVRDQVERIWRSLSLESRMAVLEIADNPPSGAPIPLHEYGVPGDLIDIPTKPLVNLDAGLDHPFWRRLFAAEAKS